MRIFWRRYHTLRVSFAVKLATLFFVVMLVMTAGGTTILYLWITSMLKEQFRTELIDISQVCTENIDGGSVVSLGSSPDEGSESYRGIKEKLRSFENANENIVAAYILRQVEGKDKFEHTVYSSSNAKRRVQSGREHNAPKLAELRQALAEPVAQQDFDVGEKDSAVVYAPIYDSQRASVAVLGIEMSTEPISEKLDGLTDRVIKLYLPAFVFLLLLSWGLARRIASPIQAFSRAATRVGEGDFKQRIEIRTRDEFGDLAYAFNKMTANLVEETRHLNQKIQELATINRIGQQVVSTLKLKEVLKRIVDSAAEALGAEIGSLVLVEEMEQPVIRHRDKRVTFAPDLRKAFDQLVGLVAEKVIKRRRTIVGLPKTLRGKVPPQAAVVVEDLLAVPVVSKKEVSAVVCVYNKTSGGFEEDDRELLQTFAANAAVAIENGHLYEQIRENFLATIRALAEAVDAKDPYTRGHSDRVTRYAVTLAEELGLSFDEVQSLEVASILHDIGKIGVREEILTKPSSLNAQEWIEVKKHPTTGAQILSPVDFPWPVTPLVLYHHERPDGKGYPSGLEDKEIPKGAKILAVVDAYDAMMSDRPYRPALTKVQAVSELVKNSGSQFDAKIVEVFLKILDTKIALIQTKLSEHAPGSRVSKVKRKISELDKKVARIDKKIRSRRQRK